MALAADSEDPIAAGVIPVTIVEAAVSDTVIKTVDRGSVTVVRLVVFSDAAQSITEDGQAVTVTIWVV